MKKVSMQFNLEKIIKLHNEILSEIDGGEECRGRDGQLSDWARKLEEIQDQLSTELKQLRAERAGLIEWLSGQMKIDEACYRDEPDFELLGYIKAMADFKSKLTDSAQSGEG